MVVDGLDRPIVLPLKTLNGGGRANVSRLLERFKLPQLHLAVGSSRGNSAIVRMPRNIGDRTDELESTLLPHHVLHR